MKRFLLLLTSFAAIWSLKAQNTTWHYDFGTSLSSVPYHSTTYVTDGSIVPETSSGNTGAAGVAGVKAGSDDGSIALTGNALAGGTGAELQLIGGSGPNGKFGIANYAGSTLGAFQFNFNISHGTSGRFLFCFGNGANYAGGSGVNVSQTFATLDISIGTGSTASLRWFKGGATSGYTNSGITQTKITKNADHSILLFMNNDATSANYKYNENDYNLGGGTYDIWLDGTRILIGATTAGLSASIPIVSANIINVVTGADAPTINIDNISYSNYLPAIKESLPVGLTYFRAVENPNAVVLNWQTASELNNDHFDILRSQDGIVFSKIAAVKGQGTTTRISYYSFTDESPLQGVSYYRLRQVDEIGKVTLFKLVRINLLSNMGHSLLAWRSGTGNIKIKTNTSITGSGIIGIYNFAGTLVAKKSVILAKGAPSEADIPAWLAKGAYIATLTIGNQRLHTKFMY